MVSRNESRSFPVRASQRSLLHGRPPPFSEMLLYEYRRKRAGWRGGARRAAGEAKLYLAQAGVIDQIARLSADGDLEDDGPPGLCPPAPVHKERKAIGYVCGRVAEAFAIVQAEQEGHEKRRYKAVLLRLNSKRDEPVSREVLAAGRLGRASSFVTQQRDPHVVRFAARRLGNERLARQRRRDADRIVSCRSAPAKGRNCSPMYNAIRGTPRIAESTSFPGLASGWRL